MLTLVSHETLSSIKGFLHACIIPVSLSWGFHSLIAGLVYIAFAGLIYRLLLRQQEGAFFFSLGIGSLVGMIALGTALLSSAVF